MSIAYGKENFPSQGPVVQMVEVVRFKKSSLSTLSLHPPASKWGLQADLRPPFHLWQLRTLRLLLLLRRTRSLPVTRTCKKQIHLLAPSGALYYNTLEHENRSPHWIREYITAFKEFSKEFLERRGLARCGEGIGGTWFFYWSSRELLKFRWKRIHPRWASRSEL